MGWPNLRRAAAEWLRGPADATPRWEVMEEPLVGFSFSLSVPNCVLSVAEGRAEFFQGSKWGSIWWYPRYQHLLRWACHDLAQVLGSSCAIYMPESYDVEGATLAKMTAHLLREYGEPAPTIAALEEADGDDPWTDKGCYYIDRFTDLPPVDEVPPGPPPVRQIWEMDWPHLSWPPGLEK